MTKVIRYTARGITVFAISMFLLFFFGEGPPRPSELRPHELLMFAYLGLTMVGGLIAFRREGIGSTVILVGFVAFAATNPRILAMPPFYFFLIPGLLFGFCWLRDRGEKQVPSP